VSPAAKARAPRTPTLAHRAEYYALRGAAAVLRLLSWDAACRFGEWLGELGYRPFGIRRAVVVKQLAAAFPEWSDAEVQRVARQAYRNLGRYAVETILLPTLTQAQILALMESADGWPVIEEELAKGHGVIFATGHVGNWELAGSYVAARGVPLDAIARIQANPLVDAYINRTRAAIGLNIMYDQDAVRQVPRSLRAGRAVAFIADQGVLGLASTFVPFFGRPAKTPRGAAVFARRYELPTLFAAVLRQPNGKFRFGVERIPTIDTGDREADVDAVVAAYTAALERWVRLAPAQYFWHHRRWRRQPPDTPEALRDPTR